MKFAWPQFPTPQRLDDLRSWTASFDSYNEYHNDAYYRVKLYRGEELLNEFMIKVDISWAGEDYYANPTFVPQLTKMLAEWAADGKTNTEYKGIS
jgi:hypothetical protein